MPPIVIMENLTKVFAGRPAVDGLTASASKLRPALYPLELMPGWLRAVALANPMSYIVEALRALLLGLPGRIEHDLGLLSSLPSA